MPTDAASIAAEKFLREAAKAEGLGWWAYCEKYGIVGDAQERRIRRHEVPMEVQ